MTNNYCEFSAMLYVPKEKLEGISKHIEEIEAAIMHMDEYLGCTTEVLEDGVWFYTDAGDGEPEHVAEIARHLIDTLQLPEPFYFSYAYGCDKPRLDEFGGGAFVVELGKETIWCNPEQHLRHLKADEQDAKEYYFTLTGNKTVNGIVLDGTKAFVWKDRVMDMMKAYPEEELVLKIQGDDKTWYEKYTDGTLVGMWRDNDTGVCNPMGDTQETP